MQLTRLQGGFCRKLQEELFCEGKFLLYFQGIANNCDVTRYITSTTTGLVKLLQPE
jgi:hypothetical protein